MISFNPFTKMPGIQDLGCPWPSAHLACRQGHSFVFMAEKATWSLWKTFHYYTNWLLQAAVGWGEPWPFHFHQVLQLCFTRRQIKWNGKPNMYTLLALWYKSVCNIYSLTTSQLVHLSSLSHWLGYKHRQTDEGLDCLPARGLDSSSNPCLLSTATVLDITSGDLLLWTLTTSLRWLSIKHWPPVIRSACCSSARTGGETREKGQRTVKHQHTLTHTDGEMRRSSWSDYHTV